MWRKEANNMISREVGMNREWKKDEGEIENPKRTIAKVTTIFQGKEYSFEEDFGYNYPPEAAEYMFEEGNCSDDQNLSGYIKRSNPEFTYEFAETSDEIEIKSIEIEFR